MPTLSERLVFNEPDKEGHFGDSAPASDPEDLSGEGDDGDETCKRV